jgi:HlyD family secretion protein
VLRRLPFFVVPVALALFGWWYLQRPTPAPTVYGIVESRRVEVGSKVGGRVTEVLAEEGALVDPETPLVRFDFAELRARLRQSEARLAEASARADQLTRGLRPEEIAQAEAAARQARALLESARNGPRPQEIAQARADLQSLEADLTTARATAARIEKLAASGDISRQAFDEAVGRRNALTARAEAARQRVQLLEAGTRAEDRSAAEQRAIQAEKAAAVARLGTRPEELAQARARVEQAQAELAQVAIQLSEIEVRAPSRARIETISVRPGDLVPAGRPVVTLLEESQTWVRAYVPAPDLPSWPVNAKVEVSFDNGATLSGTIQQIAAQAEFLPRNVQTRDDRTHQVFAVKIRVPSASLRSGMAASVRLVP